MGHYALSTLSTVIMAKLRGAVMWATGFRVRVQHGIHGFRVRITNQRILETASPRKDHENTFHSLWHSVFE